MLANTNKVDVISETAEGVQRLIIAVECGEWDLPESATLLREKVDAYASFALDGQMNELYPESAGKPVSIVIRPFDPVPTHLGRLIDRLASVLKPEGLTVSVELMPVRHPITPQHQAA